MSNFTQIQKLNLVSPNSNPTQPIFIINNQQPKSAQPKFELIQIQSDLNPKQFKLKMART